MPFDFRAFAAAHEPWAFTDARGRTWTPARELSALEAIRWSQRFEGCGTLDDWLSVSSRLVRTLFPFRIRYWWTGDPYRSFQELPLEARKAAIDDLFRPRRPRTSPPPPSPTRTTTPKPSSGGSRTTPTEAPRRVASGSTPP